MSSSLVEKWQENQQPRATNAKLAELVGCTEGRIRQIKAGGIPGRKLAERLSLITDIPVMMLLFPPPQKGDRAA